MQITIDLDDEAATVLATIIRRLTPDDDADALTARGVNVKAWYRAVDAPSPQLSIETPASPAAYPGEPGSRAERA
jgi:hypothetical protein